MPVSGARPTASPGGFREIRWRSQALQRRARFLLHLPGDYAEQPARRYPALYFLHGSGHDPSSVVQQVRPQEQLEVLGAALLVIPDGEQGWWLDSPAQRQSNFGQYVLELVALIDGRYRHTALHFCTAQEAFDRSQNEAFAAALRSLGIPFEYAAHPGAHDTAWVRVHLRGALAFHRRAFDQAFQS